MSSASPSPNSSPSLPSSPLPNPTNSPPDPPSAPPPQLNPPPPTLTPPPQSPPPSSGTPPPQPPMASQPPTSPPPQPALSPPPPVNITPPSSNPPPQPSSPPPVNITPPSSNPPPQQSSPPPTPSPPDPPASSPPPPPSSDPPVSPPPSINPPPPPPLPEPPTSTPSPPTPGPPENPPSPPQPPRNSPPPSSRDPPSSPPPPSNTPPQNSPPPSSMPPPNSASPPVPSRSPPASNSPPISPSPPSRIVSPPPPSILSPPSLSPPSPSVVPPRNNGTDNSNGNGPESSQSPNGGGISTGGTVAIGLVLGLLFLGIFGIAACFVWKRKKRASGPNGGHIMPSSLGSSTESDSGLVKVHISASDNRSGSGNDVVYSPRVHGGLGNSRSWFTHEELVEATNGFSTQNLLGEGGFGSVYKGILKDGRTVAVKQLKSGGGQGEREFRAEVEIISRIHHRHLVSLVGYCISEEKRLLVYDYVSNDTLYFHLHGEGRPVMSWATRVKIAIGAARGIAYLHEDCHPRIFHRDIKSSNILLDNNFEAQVSDFGLAKLAMDANTHITTRVMGTFGYMAPEYASSGKLTEKSDVYSFGVVLLELITGLKPVDTSRPLGEESLVEWARPLLNHTSQAEGFGGLVDPRLQGHYVDGEMIRMIEAAAACVRHSSAKRPKMGQVVRALDSSATADLTNGVRIGESEIVNSEELSAEIRLFRRMAFGSQDYSTDFLMQNSSSRRS